MDSASPVDEGVEMEVHSSSIQRTSREQQPDVNVCGGFSKIAGQGLAEFMRRGVRMIRGLIENPPSLIKRVVNVLWAGITELRVRGLQTQAGIWEINYQRLGNTESIQEAVECRRQALSLTSEEHTGRPYRLATLGVSLCWKFERLGELSDVNQAIQCLNQARLLTADDHSSRTSLLNNLGGAYLGRFRRLGEVADVDNAIECHTQAVQLAPNGHPGKLGCLTNLGNSHRCRFERVGELANLDRAIECQTQAVQLTPDGHPNKPGRLNNLGISLMRRFEHTGQLEDLGKGLECQTQAVRLTSEVHPDKSIWLNNLGTSWRVRFERLGILEDMDKAIECHHRAVQLTPDGHPDKPGRIDHLGTSYLCRFEHRGEIVDLGEAIECHTQAVQLTPNCHPGKAILLNNLGNSYAARFERLDELAYLDKRIQCLIEAMQLTPNGHPQKPTIINNLGNSYSLRFQRLGDLVDVDKAIEWHAQALQLTFEGHPDWPSRLNNLGNSYKDRFERLGELADLQKAIECQTQAVQLTPEGHPSKPNRLNNLRCSYMRRFECLGELADLGEAVKCQTQAVELAHEGHPSKTNLLNNLGNSYMSRFKSSGELTDLDMAIECSTQALQLAFDGHPDRPSCLNNLGMSYGLRFKRSSELADVDKAIECESQAVKLTPDGHPNKIKWLHNLGISHETRFDRLQELVDLECAQSCFMSAAQHLLIDPGAQLRCARKWAKISTMLGHSPQQAYERCMDLLPQLIWLGKTVNQRYNLINNVGDLASEAASWAIAVQSFDLAVEWLEAGRSIVWNQMLQLRTPLENLSLIDPLLAQRLKDVAGQLECASSRQEAQGSLLLETDLERAAQHHRRLAAEWEELLEQARNIPGFCHFMRPPKADRLKQAACDGPVVLINTHPTRCDALILLPQCNDITHIALTDLLLNKASEHAQPDPASLARHRERTGGFGRVRQRLKAEDPFKAGLVNLWQAVVKPILDGLAFTDRMSADELPHVIWCTTGILAFAPLHAAGPYDGVLPNAFDLVISSYTPSLGALIASSSSVTQSDFGILAVSQEYTQGLSPIPGTVRELAEIKKHAHTTPFLQLDGSNATVDSVLAAMDEYKWVHLACHAAQNPGNPAHSAFHLYDGKLTLEAITQRQFKNKGLAFLSACETATGDGKLPDEAVHLAAGMMIAGYPSVIATMWSIADVDGPAVAGEVYAELLKDGKMNHRGAARALHKGIASLREKIGVDSFERWVPFLHIGV